MDSKKEFPIISREKEPTLLRVMTLLETIGTGWEVAQIIEEAKLTRSDLDVIPKYLYEAARQIAFVQATDG